MVCQFLVSITSVPILCRSSRLESTHLKDLDVTLLVLIRNLVVEIPDPSGNTLKLYKDRVAQYKIQSQQVSWLHLTSFLQLSFRVCSATSSSSSSSSILQCKVILPELGVAKGSLLITVYQRLLDTGDHSSPKFGGKCW